MSYALAYHRNVRGNPLTYTAGAITLAGTVKIAHRIANKQQRPVSVHERTQQFPGICADNIVAEVWPEVTV